MGAIDRLFALRSGELRAVARVAPIAALAIVFVRVLGLKRTLRWATPTLGARSCQSTNDVAVAVARASRYLPGATCLSRSAALARILRKKSVAANLQIGVDANPMFAAHAWVEVGGVALTDVIPGYTALPLS